MKFSDNKPVFLQIKVWIEDHILRGEWSAGTQLPSVRELSVRFGVNANTVVRTYERMLFDGSVRSVRGVGFFVADDARDMVVARRREEFYSETLPAFVEQMELLGVGMQEVTRAYDENMKNRNNDDTKDKQ
ncbi:MAG: GntR family transcriptional regulator [Alistipes sp.]|nr:GntR family transcriptional regulator [Alistipes sp.]